MVGFILTYDNILFLYLYLLPTTIINVYMHLHKQNICTNTNTLTSKKTISFLIYYSF